MSLKEDSGVSAASLFFICSRIHFPATVDGLPDIYPVSFIAPTTAGKAEKSYQALLCDRTGSAL